MNSYPATNNNSVTTKSVRPSAKNAGNFQEISEFLDRAQQTMLGFGPDWSSRILSSVANSDSSYPPYDLIRFSDHHFRIVIAVAGFSREDLDVVVEKQRLTISGKKPETSSDNEEASRDSWKWLHKGIATRAFSRTFTLADYTHVADAKYENGLLTVDVIREIPEDLAPKKISIS